MKDLKITLYMRSLMHNRSTPIKLIINRMTYYYEKDLLFEKLIDYIGEDIEVIYIKGKEEKKRTRKIISIDLKNIPTLHLD